jgi:hypothetical protein
VLDPIQWENRFVIPSTRPGLGIEPDETVLAKHPPHEFSGDLLKAMQGGFDAIGPAIAQYV